MKNLKLIKLTLLNFKGASFTFEPNGKNASIFGDNATGKTSLFDGLCWLLFGKDSKFDTNFEIKNLDENNQAAPKQNHKVEGVFWWNEAEITLKKSYSEIWTKKRNTGLEELTGHDTKFWINEVPCKAGEYKLKIAEIATEDQFKTLTNPLYFPERMKWQDRRAMLISLCGDVPDSVILAGHTDLAPLYEALSSRSIDDHKKVMTAAKKAADEKLAPIGAKIEENSIALKTAAGINHLIEIEKVNKLSTELDQITATITDLKSGDGLVELRRQLLEAGNSRKVAESQYTEKLQAVKFDQREALNVLETEIGGVRRVAGEGFREQTRLEASALMLAEEINHLRAEWNRIDAEQKAYSPESCCPTCGQDIPEEKKAETKAAHNLACASLKKDINTKGQAAAAKLAETKKRIAELEGQAKVAAAKETELYDKIVQLQAKDLTADERLQDAKAAISMAASLIESIKAKMAEVEGGQVDNEAITRAEAKAEGIKAAIAESRKRIAIVEASQKASDRKAELEAEESQLQKEAERCNRELDMIKRFDSAKISSLEGRINSMFEIARFKMFTSPINGEIQPCCQVLSDGVPFESNLNNGARIQTGLDIIKTISQMQGLSLPVVIDNNESVTQLPAMDCQVIGMFVSAADKTLRVEIAQ